MAPIPRKQAGSRTAANDTATSSATTITLSGGQPEKQPERRGAWAKHWGLAVNRARKDQPAPIKGKYADLRSCCCCWYADLLFL